MLLPISTVRSLRQQMTGSEKILWALLRGRRFENFKFRRKHPIAYECDSTGKKYYIADFYCADKRLVLELDGKHRDFPGQRECDLARDAIIRQFAIKVLHIPKEEFFPLSDTLKKIEAALSGCE